MNRINFPHRRNVKWYDFTIKRTIVSADLRTSTNSIGTSSQISKYAQEIEQFISSRGELIEATNLTTSENVAAVFALEKYLEEFLVSNWSNTELGKKYDIYKVDDEIVGQQFQTDTGFIDILAQSKDNKELVVIELKKGRSSDTVVGQVQRYMGDIIEEGYLQSGQVIKGIIIALEDDNKLKRALKVTSNIDFYRYEINFKLYKS